MQVIIYLVFIAINVGMAKLHNWLRIRAIQNGKKAISHGWWGLIYGGMCALAFSYGVSFISSIVLLHASIFPVAFNIYSKLPAFHLSLTSTALFDRALVKLKFNDTEAVNVIAQLLSIGLLTWSIIYS